MEGRHDVLFGDTCRFQCVANAVFGAVTLYPDLAVDDVQMHEVEVDALVLAFPTGGDDKITVLFRIEDRLVDDPGLENRSCANGISTSRMI